MKPFELRVLDSAGNTRSTLKVRGKERVSFELSPGEPGVDALLLRVDGGGKSSGHDQRILNFRIFNIAVVPVSEILESGAGLTIGSGWHPLETYNGETFRWAGPEVFVEVQNPEKVGALQLDLEPGPGVSFDRFELSVFDTSGERVGTIEVRTRQHVTIPLPRTNDPAKLCLKVEGGGKAIPGDSRILTYRAFAPAV